MTVRQPCKSCPWRIDQTGNNIPGFSLELAEGLARTCDGQFGSPMMACHQSREGEEFICAGWLARHGRDSIAVRLQLMAGELAPEALESDEDWPELHADFGEMIEKLRSTA